MDKIKYLPITVQNIILRHCRKINLDIETLDKDKIASDEFDKIIHSSMEKYNASKQMINEKNKLGRKAYNEFCNTKKEEPPQQSPSDEPEPEVLKQPIRIETQEKYNICELTNDDEDKIEIPEEIEYKPVEPKTNVEPLQGSQTLQKVRKNIKPNRFASLFASHDIRRF